MINRKELMAQYNKCREDYKALKRILPLLNEHVSGDDTIAVISYQIFEDFPRGFEGFNRVRAFISDEILLEKVRGIVSKETAKILEKEIDYIWDIVVEFLEKGNN